jgi:hypothetical protein
MVVIVCTLALSWHARSSHESHSRIDYSGARIVATFQTTHLPRPKVVPHVPRGAGRIPAHQLAHCGHGRGRRRCCRLHRQHPQPRGACTRVTGKGQGEAVQGRMSDNADMASDTEALQNAASIRQRKPEPAANPTDLCLNCGEKVKKPRRWCDAHCRDAWQLERGGL